MTGLQPNTVWWIVVLVALAAGLVARRPSLGTIVRGVFGWAAIAFVIVLIVAHRHEIGGVFTNLAGQLGISSQQVSGETVRIRMSPDGHFWARVSLNGVSRTMLVDSGATITAISEATATAAGITTNSSFPIMIDTANGTVMARRGKIEALALGPLRTRDLSVVVSENFGDLDVLGMNFLSRLGSWRVEGKTLILEPDSTVTAETNFT
ncbi:retropepsin-like aspartic protease family protein [Stakelama tenebrarum]|uniref:TIGR02281 family clan AA aspartic protease n=1 Tax=Stakelama tenebrarum TaxID=2711215 RepID=A0A6G6Y5V0_9SPHN|nr:TIGR02281 family clan AA aspartic protease [Sphingosinithalassobacter tenebrarum]QIG80295.1 TIGR02281 family clan AA aspartic protease [Sphingosinithalassobacter tenebrarum]